MADFNKEEYAKNRKNKIRGQGKIDKPKVVNNDTATVYFINGQPTKANRWQRRKTLKK